ncbi:biopolymer transporter ExbD [Sphingopyxis sp. H050]|jgi:biopolymer transport protein ExbD|uniref:ExbD/TolR family protein n=1 Tax=Sphingopyxis sp. H050 TaxID=1759072 RepID=UPI000736D0CE|nr:biopolymer transporter ExbD [Sphingopyxis sp. H050]KTE19137.1 biopolymer transporter ExbD [Sphingopyxis sp. H050]
MRKLRSRFHQSVFRADPNGDPDINTTPLIDVMLVMLVMFIITIPPPTHSVDITLPIGGHAEVRDENRVTIDTRDIIRWNGEPVDLAQLGQLVKLAADRPEQATLMFEPEARARYLRVDEAIGAIRRNGGSKLAFPGIHQYGGLI